VTHAGKEKEEVELSQRGLMAGGGSGSGGGNAGGGEISKAGKQGHLKESWVWRGGKGKKKINNLSGKE